MGPPDVRNATERIFAGAAVTRVTVYASATLLTFAIVKIRVTFDPTEKPSVDGFTWACLGDTRIAPTAANVVTTVFDVVEYLLPTASWYESDAVFSALLPAVGDETVCAPAPLVVARRATPRRTAR